MAFYIPTDSVNFSTTHTTRRCV